MVTNNKFGGKIENAFFTFCLNFRFCICILYQKKNNQLSAENWIYYEKISHFPVHCPTILFKDGNKTSLPFTLSENSQIRHHRNESINNNFIFQRISAINMHFHIRIHTHLKLKLLQQ